MIHAKMGKKMRIGEEREGDDQGDAYIRTQHQKLVRIVILKSKN